MRLSSVRAPKCCVLRLHISHSEDECSPPTIDVSVGMEESVVPPLVGLATRVRAQSQFEPAGRQHLRLLGATPKETSRPREQHVAQPSPHQVGIAELSHDYG